MKTLHFEYIPYEAVFRTLLTLWLALSLATSCLPDPQDDITMPEALSERIDMEIEGALNETIHLEGDNGLIITGQSQVPYFNFNEHLIRIQLDEATSLEFSVYDAALSDPLSDAGHFSSYPAEDIDDRLSYVIVNYVAGEGSVLYSTTLEDIPPQIQPNIFEVREVYSNGFNVRIRDLILHGTEHGQPGTSLKVNGTFIALQN